MKFTPRIHANGGVCCSNPKNLCDTCKSHVAQQVRAQLPAAPDPYARGVAALRAANGTLPAYTPTTGYAAPDPYAAGIQALRETNS